MTYQIASKTEKGRKKTPNELNGDCCGWIEESGCVVVALADGVGSCKSDSRASKTACDLFLAKCQTALRDGEMLTEEKLVQYCREIDPVLAVVDDETCFCAVVWRVDGDTAIWFHVGDTRIYKYNKVLGCVQITQDDHGKAENVESKNKKYGKYVTDHGALIPQVGVCATIGDREFKFHTGTFGFLPGESIVLCSDGMYHSSTFEADVNALLGEADMVTAIQRITTTDDDDNSLLVLRRNMEVGTSISLRELMDDFGKYKAEMPFNALVDRFSAELESMLAETTYVDGIVEVVTFMKNEQLYPDRERIDRIFKSALQLLAQLPAGNEKQQMNGACFDLKDILRYVFTH